MIKTTKIETPLGEMAAAATSGGICLLEFSEGRNLSADYEELAKLLNTKIIEGWNVHLWRLKKQLKEYFKGKRKKFSLWLVTPGTEFQHEVWDGLKKIPYGETTSYQKQAESLKNPEAARAVAQANSTNRIAIIIPCHRVIGSDGSLVGYSGGLQRKKWLIDHERKFSGKAVELDLF
jgi:AraC family transcriptional regulator, regulatory protein of adaptative response / methylated-DNA-[protein]-cysteine methyltransferase